MSLSLKLQVQSDITSLLMLILEMINIVFYFCNDTTSTYYTSNSSATSSITQNVKIWEMLHYQNNLFFEGGTPTYIGLSWPISVLDIGIKISIKHPNFRFISHLIFNLKFRKVLMIKYILCLNKNFLVKSETNIQCIRARRASITQGENKQKITRI